MYFPWVPPEFDPDLAEASRWEGCSAGPSAATLGRAPSLSCSLPPRRLRNGVKYCKVLRLPEVRGAAPAPLPSRASPGWLRGMQQRPTRPLPDAGASELQRPVEMPPLGLGGLPGGSGRWTGLVFQFVTWRALSRGLSAFVTVRQVEEALRGRPGIGGSQGRGPGRGVSGEAFPRRWRLSEPWGCSLASASWRESGREPWAKPRSGDRRGRAEEGRRGWSRSAAHGAPPGTGPAGEGGRADRPSQSRSQQNQLSGFFGG